MSNFLTLCQEFRSKAGIAGTGPASVVSQTGEYGRLVTWVRDTWLKIQNEPYDWKWMWDEYSLDVTTGINIYVLTNVEKIHKKTFTYYSVADGVTARVKLKYIDWETYQKTYPLTTDTPSNPEIITQKPNGQVKIFPTPDADYTVEFEYQSEPQTLSANADEPDMPPKFHEIILYLALIDHGGFEEASEVYIFATNQYNSYFKSLLWKQELKTDEAETVRVE